MYVPAVVLHFEIRLIRSNLEICFGHEASLINATTSFTIFGNAQLRAQFVQSADLDVHIKFQEDRV